MTQSDVNDNNNNDNNNQAISNYERTVQCIESVHLNVEGQNFLCHPHGFSRSHPKLANQSVCSVFSLILDEWHGRIECQFQHIPGASVQIQECRIRVPGVPSENVTHHAIREMDSRFSRDGLYLRSTV